MINPKDIDEAHFDEVLNKLTEFEANPESLAAQIKQFFEQFDTDKNESLDKKELRHFMEALFKDLHLRFPITDDFVFSVFQKIDVNHDNRIELSEL
jgi:Ca2+-binding EF-hand superfamily protein